MTDLPVPAWVLWVGLFVFNIGAVFIARWAVASKRVLPADRVAGIGLVVAIDVLVVLVAFVMDPSSCTGSHRFACLLNKNAGILALGAVVVAAITIFVNARTGQLARRRESAIERDAAIQQLRSAADELAHNLQHYTYEGPGTNHLLLSSTTRFDETFEILQTQYRSHYNSSLVERVRTLRRVLEANRAAAEGLGGLDEQWRLVSALDPWGTLQISQHYLRQRVDHALQGSHTSPPVAASNDRSSAPGSRSIDAFVLFDDRAVTHSVRILMEASFYHPAALVRLLEAPSFRWLKAFSEEMKEHRTYAYYHASSEIDPAEAAKLRGGSGRAYCWMKDSEIDGVEIVVVNQSFGDLAHVPH